MNQTFADPPDLRRLGDEMEIEALLVRYCYAVDAGDWPSYRAMFTDDARVDYSAAGLPVGTVDDVVDYLTRHHAAMRIGMHYLTNVETGLDGDRADVVAMWFNAVQLPGAADMSFFRGRWHETLTRTPSGWRIAALRLEVVP
ncbi:MAG: nuclear transport factor 2 family protein [Actinomycetota bacterium]|nr:nuclear transport factor 2 family protein [Actinomycetota bacterium]